ncbi:MAG: MATE family efflux transporter [Planctomycetota bacterium]
MTPVRRELLTISALAWPVVLTRLATLMLGLVDTLMVGRLGVAEMEAVGLADVCIFGSLILAFGVVQGIDPIVSQAKGAGDRRRMGLALQRGIVIALLLVPVLSLFWYETGAILRALGQTEANGALANVYARTQIFSIAPVLVFVAMQQYLLGRGLMKTPLVVAIAANFANVAFNEVLIFGRLGFPAMGVEGAAIATGLTRVFSLIALVIAIRAGRLLRGGWTGWSRDALKLEGLAQVLVIGIPIGLAFGLEVWAFQTSTLLAGRLPSPNAAAHIIVLRMASLAFMVPLGISVATSTRVGNLIGKRDYPEAQLAAWVALGLGGAIMAFSTLAFVFGSELWPRMFTRDPEAIALAAAVFPVAAAFQFFDGAQAVGAGVLRGMGHTQPTVVFNLLGFWALGIPLGWLLGIQLGYGLAGIWWGLAAGLLVVAALFVGWIQLRGPARLGLESS